MSSILSRSNVITESGGIDPLLTRFRLPDSVSTENLIRSMSLSHSLESAESISEDFLNDSEMLKQSAAYLFTPESIYTARYRVWAGDSYEASTITLNRWTENLIEVFGDSVRLGCYTQGGGAARRPPLTARIHYSYLTIVFYITA